MYDNINIFLIIRDVLHNILYVAEVMFSFKSIVKVSNYVLIIIIIEMFNKHY